MAENQSLHGMGFVLGNHKGGSSSSNHSSERKEKKKPGKQQKGEALMNKKQNRDIVGGKDKKIITSGDGTYAKFLGTKNGPSIERERRKKMKEMFEDLSDLIPQLPPKVDKATIIHEAVNYIKDLQGTLENLEKKKQERAQHALKQIMGTTSGAVSVSGKQKVAFDKTWAASNMVLNIRGNEAQFSICTDHRPGIMTNIASVLEKHNVELISATISANRNGNTCMIQVHVKQEGSDANSAEETYRKVAEEITPWIA